MIHKETNPESVLNTVWRITIFLFALFFLEISSAFSQLSKANYIQCRYSGKLSTGTVEDFYFDADEFLWVSTQNGIFRLDGINEHFFNKIVSKDLSCIRFGAFDDNNGCVKGEDGTYYSIDNGYKTPRRLTNPITPFKNWVLKSNAEKIQFERTLKSVYGEKTVKFFRMYSGKTCFFPVNSKKCFFVDESGKLYVVSNHSVRFLGRIKDSEKDGYIYGNYFFYNTKNGARVFNDAGELEIHSILSGNKYLKKSDLDKGYCIYKTSRGYLVLKFQDRLYLLSPSAKGFRVDFVTDNLSVKSIKCIEYIPGKQILIVGTEGDGLYLLRKSYFNTIRSDKLNMNYGVYSSTPINSCDILLSNGTIFNLCTNISRNGLKIKDVFGAIYLWDSKGCLWYFDDGKLFKLNKEFKLLNKWDLKSDPFNIESVNVMSEYYGNVWLSGEKDIVRINKHGEVSKISIPDLLPNERITTFYFFSKRKVWVGTNLRLIEYNLLIKKSKPLLSGANVRVIYKDYEGDIWIGTYGDGFFHYGNGVFSRGALDFQLNLLIVHDLILDNNGIIWVSSNNGLMTISKPKLLKAIREKKNREHFVAFSREDGLVTNEFNGGRSPCVYYFGKQFFFPSIKGLVFFDPEDVANRYCGWKGSNGKIFIDKIVCDGRKVNRSDFLSLSPEFKYLNVDFAVPYWGKDDNLKIEYKLSGFDNKRWYSIKPGQQIRLTNLPYGNYGLVIKVGNYINDGTIAVKKIKFEVRPFYYQTIWFKTSITIALGLFIYFLYRLRLNFLIRERNRLQREVADKVNRLVKSKQELEISFNRINSLNEQLEQSNDVRAKLVSIFVHDLKSPMRFLSLVAKKVYLQNDLLTQEQIKEMTGELYSYSVSTMNYIEQFLLWQAVNQNGFVITIEEVEITELFDEIYTSFVSICQKQGNTLLVKSTPEIIIKTDRMLLLAIVRNLLDNANKYTFNGRIELSAEFVSNDLEIKIKDTGRGMTPDVLEMVKGYLNQNSLGHVNTHIGYQIVGDFMKKLNGTIELVSEGEDRGLEVILRFQR